jgi:hypothetical protein
MAMKDLGGRNMGRLHRRIPVDKSSMASIERPKAGGDGISISNMISALSFIVR